LRPERPPAIRLPEAAPWYCWRISKLLTWRSGNDLEAQTVTLPDDLGLFEIDPFAKYCLINGFDELDYTLSHRDKSLLLRTGMGAKRLTVTSATNAVAKARDAC
jgi:hypothetical protein